jgi:hypothetical protein
MSNIIGSKRTLILATGLGLSLNCAIAAGEFPIEGVFTQNEPCKGDGTAQQFLRVQITPKNVSYSGGICSIDTKQQDGNKLSMQVTCKFTSGAVMASGVAFTKRDDNTFDMVQQDGTYKAVLYRCSG